MTTFHFNNVSSPDAVIGTHKVIKKQLAPRIFLFQTIGNWKCRVGDFVERHSSFKKEKMDEVIKKTKKKDIIVGMSLTQ